MYEVQSILVLLSGGADSATCLAKAVNKVGADKVCCLNMYYGQRLDKEIECAKKLVAHYGVRYIELDISPMMNYSDCSLLKNSSKKVEHKSYSEQVDSGNPITSYVPFRNGVFISIAVAIAESLGIDDVWYGAHSDDYAYSDCSEKFISLMREAVYVGTSRHILIEAPLKGMTKYEIIRDGIELNVPYELTYSCYEGRELPCGKCASCIDRRKAFQLNGTVDPLTYEEDNNE